MAYSTGHHASRFGDLCVLTSCNKASALDRIWAFGYFEIMNLALKILREIALFGVCAIITAIIGLIVVDQIVMPVYVRQGDEVAVPDLIGLTPSQAQARLQDKGLRLKEREPRWDPSVPAGQIVWQNPSARSHVKPNRTVYVAPKQVAQGTQVELIVSTGPPRAYVKIPRVTELKLDEARRVLLSLGLQPNNIRYEFSTAYEPNVVIRQEPKSGTQIKRGSPVLLIVSQL